MDTALDWSDNKLDDSNTSRWVFGSVLLHVAIAGGILAFTFVHSSLTDRWGENSETAGAIQASMVSSLPIAPRQPYQNNAVLTSETPSPAPIQNKVATIEQPKPDAIPIPDITAKPPKIAEHTAPAVLHPQPVTPQPNKAVNGETAGSNIPESVAQVAHGTVTAAVQDANFGNRFAWYGRLIEQKVAQNWYSAEVDPRTASGRRVTLTFDVTRDGAPVNPRILTSSGSASLDSSALRAVQRTDGFGPLPAGNRLTVNYSFDYHQ